jgi:CubicO group peptidase (beta-lactamase class C family)
VHPAFAPAAAYFGRLFNASSRGGGALSVRMNGEVVVDVWGGYAEPGSQRPWEKDTVTICFSTGKGVAATVIHRLVERGLVAYDAPVASYWREFGVEGKEAITVRQLLSHQAGLHSVIGLVDQPSDLLDHLTIERRLAARTADPWPGHPGYHAITYGWLLAGLARNVTGLGMAELVLQELGGPLETDGIQIGMPADGVRRFAPPLSKVPPVRPASPVMESLGRSAVRSLRDHQLTRRFAEALYLPELDGFFGGPSPLVLETEMPSVNGVFSAHALAKLYAALACDGQVDDVRLLSATTVRTVREIQTTARDAVIALRMLWRLGYHRAAVQGYHGAEIVGHFGYGGSGAWADSSTGISFGFVTNELKLIQAPVGGDFRIFHLGGLVRRSARRLMEAENPPSG